MNDDLINRVSAEYEKEINKTFDDICEMLPIVCEQIRLTMSLKVGTHGLSFDSNSCAVW